jgi:tRNA pseudouridine55 synthase
MQGLGKIYSGIIRLGVLTDTGDITGKTIESQEAPTLTLEEIQAALNAHLGRIEMPAPAYSAVKYKGRALYKYARRGVAVPTRFRISTIYEWKALSHMGCDFEHRLSCSSGTYVRSLAESVGRKLGCGATVLSLRRERIANFSIDEALTLEKVSGITAKDLKDILKSSLARLHGALLSCGSGL